MRRFALVAIVAISAGLLAAPLGASAGPSFDHLNPGGQTRLPEEVPVNVVFVGYQAGAGGPDGVPVDAADRLRAHQVRSKLLLRTAIRAWGSTTPTTTRSASPARRTRTRSSARSPAGRPAAADPVPEAVQRPEQERARRDGQPLDRRAERRAVADRERARRHRHRAEHGLLHQLVGPRRTSSSTSTRRPDEPDPDTGYNFGVERESRKIDRVGRHDGRRRGGRPRLRLAPRLVPRPVGRTGVLDRQLERRRRRPGRQRRRGLPDAADLGVPRGRRLPRGREALTRRPRAGSPGTSRSTCCSRPRRSTRVELHAAAPPSSVNLDINTYEGWAGVDASETVPQAGPAGRRGTGELRWRNALDYRQPGPALRRRGEACYMKLDLRQDGAARPAAEYPADRQPVPA